MTQPGLWDPPPARHDDPESSRTRENPETRQQRVAELHDLAGKDGTKRYQIDEILTRWERRPVTEGMTSPIIGRLINIGVVFRLKRDRGRWTVHQKYRRHYNADEILREGPRVVTCPLCGGHWNAVRST